VLERLSDAQLLRRFNLLQDPGAFTALVQRHWPTVLGVCRRLLRDDHSAEDACQAAFMVLLRKARLIAQPERLASWLYGVALRVAGKARSRAARRRDHERRVIVPAAADPLREVVRRDLHALLTAEIHTLPEKYRGPLLLCYWEGLTNEEAARQLGCPAGSMSWRLARGRELLRRRLTRRTPEIVWQ
jgi:RNA polymerase sigma factor (sigma-70 family)